MVDCEDEQARFSIQRVDGSDSLVTIQSILNGGYLSELTNNGVTGTFTTELSLTLSAGSNAQWGYQLIDGAARTTGAVLNPLQIAIPEPAFETFTFSDNCYVRSNDASSCADTVASIETISGPNTLQCNAMGDNTVLGPKNSCYESDGSQITDLLEQLCFSQLEISRPNIKYDFLGDLSDAATCETSKGWSFEDQTTCNLFAACLNLAYLQTTQPPSPSPAPTPAPTPSPIPAPTPAPTPSPTLAPRPTPIRDVKRYCKSITCSNDCKQSQHCGWHTKKNRCMPYKNHPKIVNGPSLTSPIGC